MAKTGANYSIAVDVELQTQKIQKELDAISKSTKSIKVGVDTQGADTVKKIADHTDDATKKAKDFGLEWQQAQIIMSKALDIISDMVQEVFNLNSATIEFQKVSDLSGQQLDDYVTMLSDLGSEVARTGRPMCPSRNVQMVNVH